MASISCTYMLRVEADRYDRLRRAAADTDLTMRQIIETGLEMWLQQHEAAAA